MSALTWLAPGDPFPPSQQALDDPDGLLAAGGDLSCSTLLAAYRRGIFPWYSDGQPILWWTPDPRLVLYPDRFHCSRRLQRKLRSNHWRFSLNQNFADVMAACADTPRHGHTGTWITREMRAAYQQLHTLGHAHSLEVWRDERLVGGIYGVQVGRVFFGESMFSHETDTSKAAMATLCRLHERLQFDLLDCQVESEHLLSLGAESLPRARFEETLALLTASQAPPWPKWSADQWGF
ncbi:MAG: leucyl/phenylalanyl-tRNA--protein transferase [Gammaproteobacteria bacterium HGW-Gammaproteobacteria-14]|nr:MAG: leucyl/phenylalanyl-tRNA--protein transferase [Gammaproteobacteria bacterium HGW-Gammaproteobacteria-14]